MAPHKLPVVFDELEDPPTGGGAGGPSPSPARSGSNFGRPKIERVKGKVKKREEEPEDDEAETPPEDVAVHELFKLTADVLPESVKLVAFEGFEALSSLYEFKLTVLMPQRASQDFDMESALGQRLELQMLREDGTVRVNFHGILGFVELLAEHDLGSLYRMVMVPVVYRLSRSSHSRIWVDKALPDIVTEVFTDAGFTSDDYELDLQGNYSAHAHFCQYHESDLAFLTRWFEREGLYYFFEQGSDREKLIITDHKSRHEALSEGALRYYPTGGGDRSTREAIQSLRYVARALPQKFLVKDHNYNSPSVKVEGKADIQSNGKGLITVAEEDFTLTSSDANRVARLHAEEYNTRFQEYEGSGRVFDLRPGYTFELTDHPRSAHNQEYLCIALEHRGDTLADDIHRRDGDAVEEHGVYEVRFKAIPKSTQYRPQRSVQWPVVDGLEIALVDGEVDSDYAQIDDQGRYLVRVQFDEVEAQAGKNSARVRMAQPHAGLPEGMHFPLRKGTEVMLGFLNGDPDRPVIVGAVPNPLTPSPVTESNHTRNIIHTGGDNHWEVEDQDGSQWVLLYSPPKNTFLQMGATHGTETYSPDCTHHAMVSTEGNGLIHQGGNQDITVDGDKTEDVTDYVEETYCSTQSTTVGGPVKETYDANLTTIVAAHCQENYNATQGTTTDGATEESCATQTTTVLGVLTETHGSHTLKVKGALTETCSVHMSTFGPSTQSMATGMITAGAAIVWMSGGGITLSAATMMINVAGAAIFIGAKLETAEPADSENEPVEVEISAIKNSATGAEACAVGMELEMLGLSASAVGAKAEAVGMKMALTGLSADMWEAQDAEAIGIYIGMAGLHIEE